MWRHWAGPPNPDNVGVSALLEVVVLHESDAARAEEGGADRVMLSGELVGDGRSPEPALVARVRQATTVALRPLVRLRDGFSTDGGEVVRLRGLISSYLSAGADGVVLGFLNGLSLPDCEVVHLLIDGGRFPYTFDHAIDRCLSPDDAWAELLTLPRLDQVLTSGSPRGVAYGLDELVARAHSDAHMARLIMAGGGLASEHVPWLIRAGVRAFQIGPQARPQGSIKSYVDAPLVRSWRRLLDDTTAHVAHSLGRGAPAAPL